MIAFRYRDAIVLAPSLGEGLAMVANPTPETCRPLTELEAVIVRRVLSLVGVPKK